MKKPIRKLVETQKVTSPKGRLNWRDWFINGVGSFVGGIAVMVTGGWEVIQQIIVNIHGPLSTWLLSLPLSERPLWYGAAVMLVLGIAGTIVRMHMGPEQKKDDLP